MQGEKKMCTRRLELGTLCPRLLKCRKANIMDRFANWSLPRYSALHNKPELTRAGFLFVQICSVPKQNISHKLLSSPAIAWPQSQCRCKYSPSNW